MKSNCLSVSVFLLFIFQCYTLKAQTPLSDMVNPLWGSNSPRLEAYPVVSLPYGMNRWTACTDSGKQLYNYTDKKITGFAEICQVADSISIRPLWSLMPMSDKLVIDKNQRAAGFEHYNEKAMPYHYRVRFDNGIITEITPTERAASIRFKYAYGGKSFILLDVGKSLNRVHIIPEERKIVGYVTLTADQTKTPHNLVNYFVIKFLREFNDYGVVMNDGTTHKTVEDKNEVGGAWIQFDLKPNEIVTTETASSFISIEQAERNLEQDLNHKTFETVKQLAQKRWDDELAHISVKGGSEGLQLLFYTCFYRTLLEPQVQYDIDPMGNNVHYSPYDGKMYNERMFAGNIFCSNTMPFWGIINSGLQAQMARVKQTVDPYSNKGISCKSDKWDTNTIKTDNIDSLHFIDMPRNTYSYNFILQPWRTQKAVRQTINQFVGKGLDSFNIDNSFWSWYLFSAMGFYPVFPDYALGSPAFDEVTIQLSDTHKFSITAQNNTDDNVYVQSATLNGKENYNNNYIRFKDIVSGGVSDLPSINGTLLFMMSNEPNKQRGVEQGSSDSAYAPPASIPQAAKKKPQSVKSKTVKKK